MKPHPLLNTAATTLICSLVCLTWPASKADSRIQFSGVPVELTISQVSEHRSRVELSPLDEHGKPQAEPSSAGFVPFSTTEKMRLRELAGDKELRADQFRVTIKPQPLTVTVRRADGTLVQQLTFDNVTGTNSIAFQTDAPVLGLGEGASV